MWIIFDQKVFIADFPQKFAEKLQYNKRRGRWGVKGNLALVQKYIRFGVESKMMLEFGN